MKKYGFQNIKIKKTKTSKGLTQTFYMGQVQFNYDKFDEGKSILYWLVQLYEELYENNDVYIEIGIKNPNKRQRDLDKIIYELQTEGFENVYKGFIKGLDHVLNKIK